MNKCIFDKVLQLLGMNRIIMEKELEKAHFKLEHEGEEMTLRNNKKLVVVSYKLESLVQRFIGVYYDVTDNGMFVQQINIF